MADHIFSDMDSKQSKELYRSLFENMLNGIAYCRMLYEKGKPVDFIYLNVNKAFESLTGLKDAVGRKVTEVIPGIKDTDSQLIETSGRVAKSGKPEQFEVYLESLKMWLFISVYCPKQEHFVAVFDVITERKQMEESLKKSEEQFRTLFEQSQDAVFITIPDGHIVSANPAACNMFGMTEQEICKVGRAGIVDSNDPRLVLALEVRKQKGYVNTELTCIRKNGERFTAEVSSVIASKEPIYSFVILRDVSERKRAEEALQKMYSDMQSFLHTADTGLTRCSRNLYYLSANSAYAKLAGVPVEQIVGKRIVDVMGDEGLASIMPYVERVLSGERVEYETPVPFKGSGARYLHVVYTPDEDHEGNIAGWVASVTDITERKQADKKVSEQAELLDLTSDAIIVRTMDNVITFWNKGAEQQYGWEAQDVVRKFATHDLLKTFFPIPINEINDMLHRTNRWEGDLVHSRRDGSQIIVSSRWVLKRDEHNTPIEILEINNDITKRKQAEEEKLVLEQQFLQAQKLESLGVLAGGIAHDFNNLLAVIIGHCSIAQLRPSKALESLEPIEKAAKRAAELCQQMLAYAGKTQFIEKQVNITSLVEEMIEMLKSTLSKNVEMTTAISPDLPSIVADVSQIRQIVMNLIINASESIGEAQGKITVSLAKSVIKDRPSVKDHLGKPIPIGNYICLEVTDTGCGMDEKTKQRIFEPFYTTKFTGRGLGMSAVLGIITAHKGSIQLLSQPDKGSIFKIYLPIQKTDYSEDESDQQSDTFEPWQGSGTILLVEDEEQVMSVAKVMLEELGFEVVTAINGKKALELFLKGDEAITLVVTDIGMPVMDGYTLINELKKLKPELPIIISSGFGSSDISSRIACEDISGLVSKPYNFNQIQEVLKSVVEGAH